MLRYMKEWISVWQKSPQSYSKIKQFCAQLICFTGASSEMYFCTCWNASDERNHLSHFPNNFLAAATGITSLSFLEYLPNIGPPHLGRINSNSVKIRSINSHTRIFCRKLHKNKSSFLDSFWPTVRPSLSPGLLKRLTDCFYMDVNRV